jgi:xylulokinase
MRLVAGIDCSTQSTKVLVCDADTGAVVRQGRAAHPDGTEIAPSAWWAAYADASDGLLEGVEAISVGGQQHGLICLDADGQVVRPALLWNDTRSAAAATELVAEFGGAQAWAEAVGSVPVASFTVTKLRWLAEAEPAAAARTERVLLPHDWLTWKLAGQQGEPATDRGDASGTGYWSPRTGDYVDEVLKLVGLHRAVTPSVLEPGATAGTFGDAVVGSGTGDNMGAALGLGLQESDVAISLGTSGTVFAVSDAPTNDASGAVAGFADATGRFLPLVCTLNATKVTDALAQMFGRSRDEFEQLALSGPSGAGGVVLLPYFDGERTPNLPDATGTLAGLRTDTEPTQLARAAYEGVACGMLDAFDALTHAGVTTDGGRLYVVGGGAHSSVYPQLLADLLQRPVEVAATAEYVARGACVQAAAVLTGNDVATVAREWAPSDGRTVEPDPTVDAQRVRAQYLDLLQRTHPESGDRT